MIDDLKYFLWILVIVLILGLFGFTASSLAAAVASLGVTAGLALQGSLSNFAGGVLILLLHPFAVGDYIIEDTNKNEGTVTEISIFYTKLHTIDNKIIVIPNGALANNSITNATKSDRRQMDLVIPIGYDADIKKAKEILEQNAEGHHRIAQLLIEKEVITAEDVEHILGPRPWRSRQDEIIEENARLKAEELLRKREEEQAKAKQAEEQTAPQQTETPAPQEITPSQEEENQDNNKNH